MIPHEGSLYLVGDPGLTKLSFESGATETLVTGDFHTYAADEQAFYFPEADRIKARSWSTGEVRIVACGERAGAIAAGGGNVYWAAGDCAREGGGSSCTLRTAPRPAF